MGLSMGLSMANVAGSESACGHVAEKTQLVYAENDHSVNETTRKRCFVEEGVVVG